MEKKNRSKPPGSWQRSSIERWAVERLDWDAGMARLESVPMRSEHITEELLEVLSEKGVQVGMDQLQLWDSDSTRTRRVSITRLAEEIGIRPDKEENLSENMVFWVILRDDREPERIIHATQAARQVAKELYRAVTRKRRKRS